jgi:hypothetical protein
VSERTADAADSADPTRRRWTQETSDSAASRRARTSGDAAASRDGKPATPAAKTTSPAGKPATPAGKPASSTGKPASSAREVAEERLSGQLDVEERSIMASVPGVHPAAAFAGAAVLTGIGVAVDLLRTGTLGTVFTVCYLTGCVLAVAWVRRSGLFWPMVAPPLLMAVAVPVVVLIAGAARPGAGIAQRLLVIGAPLVNGFPMMAWTTGLVLAVGLFRLLTQRLRVSDRSRARA